MLGTLTAPSALVTTTCRLILVDIIAHFERKRQIYRVRITLILQTFAREILFPRPPGNGCLGLVDKPLYNERMIDKPSSRYNQPSPRLRHASPAAAGEGLINTALTSGQVAEHTIYWPLACASGRGVAKPG